MLLIGIGLLAQRRYRPGEWCRSNDPKQCSVFTIGRIMRKKMALSGAEAFRAVVPATLEAAPVWP